MVEPDALKMTGTVEVDETYIGGKYADTGSAKKQRCCDGHSGTWRRIFGYSRRQPPQHDTTLERFKEKSVPTKMS